jgi:signal transduction histidine kinase/DNA-binding response OmpR family regulator
MILQKLRVTGRPATILGTILIGALLASAAISANFLSRRSVEQLRWVQHSYQVVELLMKTQLVLYPVVSGRNAMLLGLSLTPDARQEFAQDATFLEQDASALTAMTADNPEQNRRAATIESGLDALTATLRGSLDVPLFFNQSTVASVKAASLRRTTLLAQMADMIANERRLLEKRTRAYTELYRSINAFLFVALLVAGMLAIFALWIFQRSLEQGREKITDLQASRTALAASNAEINTVRRRLQSILDHATDAILLIGPDGLVRLANKGSSLLFGVPNASLLGHPAADRIVGLGGSGTDVFGIRGDGTRFAGDISVGDGAGEHADETVYILRDATERHRLSQLKNEFVSTVSHELRTPLTSIRGSLGLLISGAAGELPPKVRQFVEIAHNNSARLVHLVNDILDIEKIESGRMDFHYEQLPADAIVEQAIEANRAYAAPFDVTFRTTIDVPPLTEVRADAARVQQIMANLLSNAAKFSPVGGVVDVTMTAQPDHIRISVRDYGAGIPDEFRDRIFQRFAQADSSDRRQKGGTGLGLSISKAIVEQHGGTIGFDMPADGGTRFWFTLPCRRLTGAPAETPLAEDEPFPADQRRILIVEDDHDVARLLGFMLEMQGWKVETAHSAREAEALLATTRFDVMTLDVLLPDEDGLALFRRIRAQPATHDLPVVIVSAVTDNARRELNGDAFSVVDWIDKPIDQDRLRHAIRRALAQGTGGNPAMNAVLHVEDDPDIFKIVEAVIGTEAEVVQAPSLSDGRRALAERTFSLVILDVSLPDGSGLDLIDAIRRLADPPPILIFSASDSDSAIAARVSAALVKSRTDNVALRDIIAGLIRHRTPETEAS